MEMSLLWDLSDVLMGVMALINIPVILVLSEIAFKAVQDYEAQLKKGLNPVFKSADIGLSQKTDFWRNIRTFRYIMSPKENSITAAPDVWV